MAIRSKFELTVDFEYFWDRLSYGDSNKDGRLLRPASYFPLTTA